MARERILRYWRYLNYAATYYLLEKPRGLDFSMRAKSKGILTNGSHGYALTSKRALANILKGLPISDDDRLIDIGCGKGGVVCYATSYPFERIAGLEVEPWLVEIARRNVARLGLDGRAEVIEGNAVTFADYADYNYFFLFNPFDADIYDEVVAALLDASSTDTSKNTYIICYGAGSDRLLRADEDWELVRDDRCPYRGNTIKVWTRTTN